MKKTFTLRHMFVSIFTILSIVTNAESINYISDDGFMYGLDTETHNAELKEYSGSATEIVVPESVEYNGGEYKVTRLGDNCFSFHYLTSIDIPSSVTSIGEKCFYWCYYLTKVNIPASVTSIEDGCFMYCANLTSIYIPASVTSMESCLYGCTALESIIVDPNNPVYDSRDNCNAIIETSSNTLIEGCMNTVIPSTVTILGDCCLEGCKIKSINIPAGLIKLGADCISPSYLESIIVDPGNTIYDSRENCNAIIETSSNTMILGCMNTVIPSTVTSLESFCFYACRHLTSIEIPSSVTSIGSSCFEGCSSLKSVELPSSVTSLEFGCFDGCSSLKSIRIPASVTSIDGNCFGGCSSLASVIVDPNNSAYDSRNNCNAIIETLSNTLITGCKNTIIPSSVTKLDSYSFQGSSITSIIIPASVTDLGYGCFSYCDSLQTMTCNIPTALSGDYFFQTPIHQATLYVPNESLEQYKTKSPWKNFGNILSISTGIDNNMLSKPATIKAIYDLEGKRIKGTNGRVNIIKMSDGTTRKVLNISR